MTDRKNVSEDRPEWVRRTATGCAWFCIVTTVAVLAAVCVFVILIAGGAI